MPEIHFTVSEALAENQVNGDDLILHMGIWTYSLRAIANSLMQGRHVGGRLGGKSQVMFS